MTRAIFDSLDVDNNNNLTAAEIDNGLRELFKEDPDMDCVTMAVAKKIAREMSPNETISLQAFEERALAATKGWTNPNSDEPTFPIDELPFTHEQFP